MTCPRCKGTQVRVIDSRPQANGVRVWRRRECDCGHRWTTTEMSDTEWSALRRVFAEGLALVRRWRPRKTRR